jgi:hypothetical protein
MSKGSVCKKKFRRLKKAKGKKIERRRRIFPSGLGIFLFTTAFRPALGPIQPPI